MYKIFFLVAALSLNIQAAAKKSAKPNLDKLISAIQKQYNGTTSTSFDFEQEYKFQFLPSPEISKGKVYYDRLLGSMLWSYTEPAANQKKFYINGKKFTYYLVDKIAYVHGCYEQDTLSPSLAFLLGKGSLKDSFTPSSFTAPEGSKLSWIKLAPKEKNAPVKFIYLGAENGQVKESIVEDLSGGKNHFKFSNFKNDKIDKEIFVFTPPKGVTVEPMPNVTCIEKTKKEEKKPAVKKKKK